MSLSLAKLNRPSSCDVWKPRTDTQEKKPYNNGMAGPVFDWFLREWAATLKKRQVDFVRDLDWNKSKASLMWKGAQPYGRDDVNQVAAYLRIHPFELLMHPSDAMAIRQLRASARPGTKPTPFTLYDMSVT